MTKSKTPFRHLEDHVADKAIGHDDVAHAFVDVAALDIADELRLERAGVEQRVGFLGEVVPFCSSEPTFSKPMVGGARSEG